VNKDIPWGVYIGNNVEVVVTESYTLVFRRRKEADFLESFLLLTHGMQCAGVCQTTPCGTGLSTLLQTSRFAFQSEGDAVLQEMLEKPQMDIQFHDNMLTVTFYDNAVYHAKADETFGMETLSPPCAFAESNNVAECLMNWNMGVKEIIWKDAFIGVIINTRKHMYIYEITADSIYCRAARYVVCGDGVVFNQNFRQGYASFMIEDNTDAMQPLAFDPSLFHADACAWNDRSVYWSVSSVEKECIILNGCQGDTYTWEKPKER